MKKGDKGNITGYNNRKGGLSCNFAHNIICLSSAEAKKSFLEQEIAKNQALNSPVDFIAVSEEEYTYNTLLKKSQGRRKNSLSYTCSGEELIGVVRSIESIIASRSFMFKAANVSDLKQYNGLAKEKMSAIVVAFDLEGTSLWDGENKESFLRIAKIMEVAHLYGISFTFFNLSDSFERLNLEFYSNPESFASAA